MSLLFLVRVAKLVNAVATDETKLSRQHLSSDFVTDNCNFTSPFTP